jgi:hypothetical protein
MNSFRPAWLGELIQMFYQYGHIDKNFSIGSLYIKEPEKASISAQIRR